MGGEEEDEQGDHGPAEPLHDMDVGWHGVRVAEGGVEQAVAGDGQEDDNGPDPGKEAGEGCEPEVNALFQFELEGCGAQGHMRKEHASDPDCSGEDMEGEEEQGHGNGFSLAGVIMGRHGVNQPVRL